MYKKNECDKYRYNKDILISWSCTKCRLEEKLHRIDSFCFKLRDRLTKFCVKMIQNGYLWIRNNMYKFVYYAFTSTEFQMNEEFWNSGMRWWSCSMWFIFRCFTHQINIILRDLEISRILCVFRCHWLLYLSRNLIYYTRYRRKDSLPIKYLVLL